MDNPIFNIILITLGILISSWKIIWWIARHRAEKIALKAKNLVMDGPLIKYDSSSKLIKESIFNKVIPVAVKRAAKWMSYQNIEEEAYPINLREISFKRVKRAVLSLPPEYALKPLHEDHRGIREVAFYEALEKSCSESMNKDIISLWHTVFCLDESISTKDLMLVGNIRRLRKEIQLLKRFATLTPQYHGVIRQSLSSKVISPTAYLLLRDLTVSYSKPNVLDLKMGFKTYEPDASQVKINHERSKYPMQETFGFRICGMRVYDPSHAESVHDYRIFSKTFGRELDSEEKLIEAFRMFFRKPCESNQDEIVAHFVKKRGSSHVSNYYILQLRERLNSGKLRNRVITNLTPQLHRIRKLFKENKMLAFYSSSLLIVYEGDVVSSSYDRCTLKMIDFGHIRRQSGGDYGYLIGLYKLVSILALLQKESVPKNNEIK